MAGGAGGETGRLIAVGATFANVVYGSSTAAVVSRAMPLRVRFHIIGNAHASKM